MSNYNKATNFAVKDTLTSGDPDKVVSGAEIDNEFNAIASAVTSKADKVAAATTDNFAALDANGNLKDSGETASSIFPVGGIIMWSGAIIDIPLGWSLCDGTDGTPDLRERFVVGAGGTYSRNDTGGVNSVTLTENEIPSHSHSMDSAGSHTHTGTTSADGSHNHIESQGSGLGNRFGTTGTGDSVQKEGFGSAPSTSDAPLTSTEGDHSHTLSINSVGSHTHTINNTGGDGSHENRPPYFALAFIMKL